MQTQILGQSNSIPEGIHIAVDTCVVMDAFHNSDKFKGLFELLEKNHNTVTSTYLNYLEFSRGNDTLSDFDVAKKWFDEIVSYIHPLSGLDDEVEKIKIALRKKAGSVGTADFYLAALSMKYGDKLMILSKDHGDFNKSLFDVQAYIPYVDETSVQIYCIYKFSKNKYAKLLDNLNKTKK